MSKTINMLRGKIADTYYGLFTSSSRVSYWQELEKSQYLPEANLRQIQWQRLEEILLFAWEHNDFYRKRFEKSGLTPEEIRSPEDLGRLDILTKAEVRNNSKEMLSRGFSIETLQSAKTGGSTGKALDLYFTEECSELRNACARRHDRWTGWRQGEPIAACWGNPHLPATVKEKLMGWLLTPFIYLDTMNVTTESVRKFACEWDRVRPRLLYGHAHSIFLLAQYVRDLNLGNIKPKGILSTSMMLIPNERALIEEVFDVKVTDRYGCEELSLIASECECHEGMHLNIEHLFVEFIKDDGSYASAGEPGRIVVTDLLNRAMPFIRYQVEDVGIPTDRKCSCGRGLPLMEQVTGRVADFLVRSDGSRVAGISLIENSLTKIPGLDQMQIIQESHELLHVNIVPGKDYSSAASQELIDYFSNSFGKTVNVEIDLVRSIPPEPSGKYRFSICRIES